MMPDDFSERELPHEAYVAEIAGIDASLAKLIENATPNICCQCCNPAAKFIGRRWLCVVHYRTEGMLDQARTKGKLRPTPVQFAALVEKALARGMRCEHCDCQMIWHSPNRESAKRVVTLQLIQIRRARRAAKQKAVPA